MEASETNAEARGLFLRHEAWRGTEKRALRKISSKGQRMVLFTPQAEALIMFQQLAHLDSARDGVQVVCFTNEGHFRSCSLIREAVEEWAVKA